ncbi:MAG: lipid-binding SYLF domain-containing protein [Pseudomonadales bacterium]
MKRLVTAAVLLLIAGAAQADNFTDAADRFRSASASAPFFDDAYGYAIFPRVAKAGFIVGGARGVGRVYVAGQPVGEATLTQLTLGFQAGAQANSQIIFFQDDRAFREFSEGGFEFGGQMNATVVTANAQAQASTQGSGATASGGRNDAKVAGGYYKGMAVFIITTGGLMLEASVGGQRFSYQPIAQE